MSDKLRGGTTIGGYTAWHRGNMGPGSGLDADTVDGGYNAWHTGNDGAGSGLDADLIDGIDSDKLCKYETRTANTSASDNNKWTKFLKHEITVRYSDVNSLYAIQGIGYGSSEITTGFLKIRSKQQDDFGADPLVTIECVFNSGAPVNYLYDFGYVITQNTPSSTIDFYIQINRTYTIVTFTKLTPYSNAVEANITETYYTNQAFASTVTDLVETESTKNITSDDIDSVAEMILDTVTGTDVTDIFIYDTSKDSDGGAWREKTKHTSWYQESKNTSVRGTTNKFPAVVALVLEAQKLTIYDLTKDGIPMWMVIEQSNTTEYTWWRGDSANFPGTCISMLNGQLCLGNRYTSDYSNRNGGLACMNFIKDSMFKYCGNDNTEDGSGMCLSNISERHDPDIQILTSYIGGSGYNILDYAGINYVDMTVLSSSPIDSDTGLPYPTIAVATNGGVGIIDGPAGIGTCIDIVATTTNYIKTKSINFQDEFIYFTAEAAANPGTRLYAFDIPSVDSSTTYYSTPSNRYYQENIIPALINTGSVSNVTGYDITKNAFGSTLGLTLLAEDYLDSENGMVNYINSDYQTGWLPGDIKVATMAESIPDIYYTNTEKVVNGDFPTNIDHWDAHNSATIAHDTNRISITSNGSLFGGAYQIIETQIGADYLITGDFIYDATNGKVAVGPTPGGSGAIVEEIFSSTTSFELYFRAEAATTYVSLLSQTASATVLYFDNISVKQIVRDRSVNNNYLYPDDTISTTDVITNGNFLTDTDWSKGTGWTIGSGVASCDGTQTQDSNFYQALVFDLEKFYSVTFSITAISAGYVRILTHSGSASLEFSEVGTYTVEFYCDTYTRLYFQGNVDFVGSIDDVSAYEILLFTDNVNTDTDLVSFQGSGSAGNLTQDYNADLDYGIGPFYAMCWAKPSTLGTSTIMIRGDADGSPAWTIRLFSGNYYINLIKNGGSSTATQCQGDASTEKYSLITLRRTTTKFEIFVNDVKNGSVDADSTYDMDSVSGAAKLLIGCGEAGTDSFVGSICLARTGAGNITDEQISKIYHDEKELFEYGAKCIFNDSDIIKSLSYDEKTNLLYAGTSLGVYEFKGLTHNILNSTRNTISLSAVGGKYVYGYDANFHANIPKIDLREEAERNEYKVEYESDGLSWGIVDCSCNIFSGQGFLVDAGSAHTIRLPFNPKVGDKLGVSDFSGNSGTNNITVDRNGSNILGNAGDLILDYDHAACTLVYTNIAEGWTISQALNITV